MLFFIVRYVNEPRLVLGLFDCLEGAKVKSTLFKSLENSFIPQEFVRQWRPSPPKRALEDFVFFAYQPEYQPLLNIDTLLPVEMYLFEGSRRIPFIEPGVLKNVPMFWNFRIDRREKVYSFDAEEMVLEGERVASKIGRGVKIWRRGSVYRVIEVRGGLNEFSVSAANGSNFKSNNIDSSPQMGIFLNDISIGKATVRKEGFERYNFRYYARGGWNRLKITFTNDYYNKEKKWDRNLLIGGVDVHELKGNIYLGVRGKKRANDALKDMRLSYFRALSAHDKNYLIHFFKQRFNISNLGRMMGNEYDIHSLMENIEIAGVTRKSIFAPAPTVIVVKVPVPLDGIKVAFGYGVMEECWDKPGDGVEFRVRVDTGKNDLENILFSHYVNPKYNEEERKWFRDDVDLKKYRGREVTLLFETRGSPPGVTMTAPDNSYDWGVWGE